MADINEIADGAEQASQVATEVAESGLVPPEKAAKVAGFAGLFASLLRIFGKRR